MAAIAASPAALPLPTCAVTGCTALAEVSHHISYRGRHGGITLPYCNYHHSLLHELHHLVRDDGYDLTALTTAFTLEPAPTEDSVRRRARIGLRVVPPPVEPAPIGWNDLLGRDGDYWFSVMTASVRRSSCTASRASRHARCSYAARP
jgi:hypothetical protein